MTIAVANPCSRISRVSIIIFAKSEIPYESWLVQWLSPLNVMSKMYVRPRNCIWNKICDKIRHSPLLLSLVAQGICPPPPGWDTHPSRVTPLLPPPCCTNPQTLWIFFETVSTVEPLSLHTISYNKIFIWRIWWFHHALYLLSID